MSQGLSRRTFLKLAAGAGAAAAIPGCEPAARKLIPYVVPDENVTPGVPAFFATICNECPAGCGAIARIREGRAIKLEGNPADPIGAGALCARGQAALQGLYNPDRLAHPQSRSIDGALSQLTWTDAEKLLTEKLRAAARAGKDRVAFIGRPSGPTFTKIAQAWSGAFGSSRVIFTQALSDEPARTASKVLFGRRDLPIYRIDQADVLLSFGADFLETWRSPVEFTRQYAEFRKPRQRRGAVTIGRSAYIGSRLGLTAARSDEWIAVAPDAVDDIAWSVLQVLIKQRWIAQNSGVNLDALAAIVADYDPVAVAARTGVPAATIKRLAEMFGTADGALALGDGGDPSAHLAALTLNAVTGNFGRTVMFLDGANGEDGSTPEEVNDLFGRMRAGKIDVAMISGVNPVFDTPPSLRAAESLRKVPFVVWAGGVPDETAGVANLLLPVHHPLENWRDSAPRVGVHGLGQPVMQPVVESKPLGDLLIDTAAANGAPPPWKNTAEAVKTEWLAMASKAGATSPDDFWVKARREGGVFEDQHVAAVKLDVSGLKAPAPTILPSGLSFYAYPHIYLYDGRGADKPWLQELPEPVAQIVWDSWAEIHPDTAQKLAIADDDLIELKTEHGMIALPVLIRPTVPPSVIAAPLGQGHRAYGRYAAEVGANPFTALPAGMLYTAVTARATGDSRKLVSPLGKSEMLGRSIVESISIERFAAGGAPPKAEEPAGPFEFYPAWKYPGHKWGMTIDTNACTGCGACVTACYAENNLPFVGKEEVDAGRIMSWIRMERYFPAPAHADEAPLMYIGPMLCQQCDHAPCEPVCPVFASYHTQEGLNGQVYNRCVGTRYCENNCPYKVRRFNYYAPQWPAPLNLQLNPDVTVRGAGVMEKCTFCVQRIQFAELNARTEDRDLRDGEIVPACAQTCPAKAISFGDINDPASAMMRRRNRNRARNYRSLEEFNTQPAIVYLRGLFHERGKA